MVFILSALLQGLKTTFPIKAKTLDDFISILEREGAEEVEALPVWSKKSDRKIDLVGYRDFFRWDFSTTYEALTKTGRPILFKENYGSRHTKPYESLEIEKWEEKEELMMRKSLLEIYATGANRLDIIKERIPKINTTFYGIPVEHPNLGEEPHKYDGLDHQNLKKAIEQYGIKPYPLGFKLIMAPFTSEGRRFSPGGF